MGGHTLREKHPLQKLDSKKGGWVYFRGWGNFQEITVYICCTLCLVYNVHQIDLCLYVEESLAISSFSPANILCKSYF